MNATLQRPFQTLLVDDVEELRLLIRLALEASGRFIVTGEAENGREGIDSAEHLQPDLVLLDLAMPEMDGLEALPDIIAAAPGAKVVILSGFEETRMAEAAKGRGAVEYFEKGIDLDELVTKLLQVLETEPGTGPMEIDLTSTEGPDPNRGARD